MSDKNKIRVAVSGYFDPIHVGHLEYLRMAKELGDSLVVIVNNNHQCKLKKGKHFMDENDRVEIVKALRFVDEVFLSIDWCYIFVPKIEIDVSNIVTLCIAFTFFRFRYCHMPTKFVSK